METIKAGGPLGFKGSMIYKDICNILHIAQLKYQFEFRPAHMHVQDKSVNLFTAVFVELQNKFVK
jgi:hypothetical protein